MHSVGSTGYTASYFNFSTQQLVTQPVSQLISEIEYRAWGSAKQMTFGNGVFETATYNARLRPTSYSLNNVRLQCLAGLPCSIPSATMSWTYDYYADGRLNHAFDSENIKFDRRQEFDHVGRYRKGYTNREARGLPFDFNEPDPYRHTVQYDVWGNITSRTGRLWSSGQVDTATYTNHRRQSWSYDANGNLIGDNSKAHTYNAVNQQTYVRSLAIVGDGTLHSFGVGLFMLDIPVIKGGPLDRGTNDEGFYLDFASRAFAFPQNPIDWGLFWDLVNVNIALQRESCRNLFPGDADPVGLLAILARGDTTFGSITRGDLGGPQGGLVDAAVTTGITGRRLFLPSRVGATLIVQSAWVGANITINNNAQAPGQVGYQDYLGVGANDAVYRAITLIHELGHVASLIYGADASRVLYDANNPAQSRANSQLVYDNCFRPE